MTNTLLNFAIFWGIWLLVPMLIDGFTYLSYLIAVWRATLKTRRNRKPTAQPFFPPMITVIIPVYNGQFSLGSCLESIRKQSYPQESLQVLVVDNGSTDDSFRVFAEQQAKPFGGVMTWVETPQKGKVWALNTGIHMAFGTIVINVDCDTALHPDAVLNMAQAFHTQPDLAAATGAVEVMPVDRANLSNWKALWAACEALEYLVAFHIGRQYQSATNSLFTLAGAFSAFRREILLDTFLYDRQTVSEDTKMTLDIRERILSRDMRIGCVTEAVAYVEPTLSMSRLYAQRVRWQRGELEVAALQPGLALDVRHIFRVKGLSMPRTLMIDHTLAFPRLVWTFLLPMLYFFGYPLPLVVSANIGMYVFYAVIESLSMLACYALGNQDVRRQIKQYWYLSAVMPAYRFMLFWFRFGGFLNVLTEAPQWRVADPWAETKEAAFQLVARSTRCKPWRRFCWQKRF